MSDLPGRILDCARDLYLEKGLRGFSLRLLAGRLDVSPTALYRHFRNKEDIIHKVIEEAVKVFAGYLFASLAAGTPEERFRLSAEAYLGFALEQRKYYEVIFMAPEQIGSEPVRCPWTKPHSAPCIGRASIGCSMASEVDDLLFFPAPAVTLRRFGGVT
jgi:AcrR family transcriptional regulator